VRRTALFVLILGCSSSDPPLDAAMDTTPLDAATDISADTFDANAPRAAAPVFTPPAGTYVPIGAEFPNCALHVEIKSSTPGAVVHFTLDGSVPHAGSPAYKEPLEIPGETTITAIALAPPFAPSEVVSSRYVVVFPTDLTSTPTLSPPPGTYDGPQTVTMMSATEDSTICYTLDGSSPSCAGLMCESGTKYTAPIMVTPTADGITIKAQACSRCRKSSAIVTGIYRART
jgi:hypothetical protein